MNGNHFSMDRISIIEIYISSELLLFIRIFFVSFFYPTFHIMKTNCIIILALLSSSLFCFENHNINIENSFHRLRQIVRIYNNGTYGFRTIFSFIHSKWPSFLFCFYSITTKMNVHTNRCRLPTAQRK